MTRNPSKFVLSGVLQVPNSEVTPPVAPQPKMSQCNRSSNMSIICHERAKYENGVEIACVWRLARVKSNFDHTSITPLAPVVKPSSTVRSATCIAQAMTE
jgi:hypothetical protein